MKGIAAMLAVGLALGAGLFVASGCKQGEAPGHKKEGAGGSSSHQGHVSRDATKASSKTRTYYIAEICSKVVDRRFPEARGVPSQEGN